MMENPFNAIKNLADQIRDDVEHRVHVAILREAVLASLSRLLTLDVVRASAYQAAIDSIQKEQ